jgi:hypothetical protein
MCNTLQSPGEMWPHTNIKRLPDKSAIAYKVVYCCDGLIHPPFRHGTFKRNERNVWNELPGDNGFACYCSFKTALQTTKHSDTMKRLAIAKIRYYHPVGSFDTKEVIGIRQRVILVKEFEILEIIKVNEA